jgi:hypothetical protein
LAAHEYASELLNLFDIRREKQTFTVHYLAWHLNPRNRAAKHRDYGDLTIIFNFFKEHYFPSDYTTLKAKYVKYKGIKSEFSILSLWEEDTIADFDMFWVIASDFNFLLANLANRLRTTPPNSVFSERAFSALKLQYSRLRVSLSLAKLSLLCFLYMNRRILDRKAMNYKRNIYDLTPEEKIEEKNDILDIKTEKESGNTINDNKKATEAE